MDTEIKTLSTDLAVTAYNYALEAADWLFFAFPALASGGYEKGDLAGDWFDKKSRYLADHDPTLSTFKYQVFLGMKRFAITRLHKNRRTPHVSLDATCDQGMRFIDLLADSKSLYNPCIMEEVLEEASETLVGCSSGEETVLTEDGQIVSKDLRTILELKVEGWNGVEIAELFGLSKQLISKVLQRSAVQFATAF